MKSLLGGLLIISTLQIANAASTDTVSATSAVVASTYTIPVIVYPSLDEQLAFLDAQLEALANAAPVQPKVPVEQKVIEIHMSVTPTSLTQDQMKKRHRADSLPLVRTGTCSGSFINDNGDILTARHCVDDFDTFEVQTYDRRTYAAIVVATSAVHDLALIHIDLRHTPFFELADSVARGQTVFVLGSPLGITDTLSTGVVARIDGDVTLLDCSALPGNSGGPVFDSNDKMVGVVHAGYIVMLGMTHLNRAQGIDAVHFFLKEALDKRYGVGVRP